MLGEPFDPKAAISMSEHFRPHWSQAGAVVFITFRTADSIPKKVLQRWEREKNDWMREHAGATGHWKQALPTLNADSKSKFLRQFNRCREDALDSCHGKCVLRDLTLARIVADSLLFFDSQRYRMGDFIVMPNHVHLLASFPDEESLVTQCDSWLHFTARQINLQLQQKGKFWQQEPFDHLVRSPEQYEFLRDYIRDNGKKAKLNAGEYLYRRYEG